MRMKLLVLAMLVTMPALAAAAPPAAAKSTAARAGAATAAVALPALADPAADWAHFYATAKAEESLSTYHILATMYGDKGAPGEDCRQYLPALDAAIVRVPVGVALWRAGEVCAQALKDAALEKRYGEGVEKLVGYALARGGAGPDSKPIAVINGDDIKAVIDASGLQALYGYGEWKPRSPYLRLTYALLDPQQGIERHVAFDYLDTYVRTGQKDPVSSHPGLRHSSREAMLGAMAKANDSAARDLGIAEASRSQSSDKQVAMLREETAKGGLVSADFWWSVCSGKQASCADGLIDALLPLAEKDMAMYRIQLALCYAQGVGIDKDLGAATTLLDAAEKRWPGHAYARFAEQLLDEGKEVPAPVVERLDQAARQGNRRAMAAWTRAQSQKMGDATEVPAALLPRMTELAGKDVPPAQLLLALHYYKLDPALSREWLRRGAATGDPELMERYGHAQVYASPGPRELAAGIETMRAAAVAGDAEAMEWMGMLAVQRKQWIDANNWYAAAIDYGDNDAVVPLLEMYQEPHAGVSPEPAALLGKYQALDKSGFDDASFRRSYAYYLLGKSPTRDPVKAKALLLADADKGDVQSQYLLALDLLEGKFGAGDAKEGMQWMEKAVKQGNEGKDAYANYLYYRDRSPDARKQALSMERALVAAGYLVSNNNLAWWLCTSEDAAMRNPAEGLRAAQAMGSVDKLEPSALDTVAACHAANGDFAKAVEVQQAIVDRLRLLPQGDDDSKLGKRLELYRQHKAYVETRADEPSLGS